jgi:hypothetical protein
MILDRKKQTLVPFYDEEWMTLPDGLIIPVPSGGIFSGRQIPVLSFGISGTTAGAQTIIALNNAYVAGTSGNAIAARISLDRNRTLTDILFHITSYTGTASLVTSINWEIRTGSFSAPTTAPAGLIASGVIDPQSATGWINISGLNVSLTGGQFIWIIIADADGSAVNFANVLQFNNSSLVGGIQTASLCMTATTTNGFVATSLSNQPACIVTRYSDGATFGSPITSVAGSASSTNRRGLFMSDGFSGVVDIFAVAGTASALYNGAEIIADSNTPGGSTLGSASTMIAFSTALSGAIFNPPVRVGARTPIRAVLTVSGAATTPNKASIGTGSNAILRSAMLGGGKWYWAESNGLIDWSNDDINAWPFLMLIVDDISVAGALTLIT